MEKTPKNQKNLEYHLNRMTSYEIDRNDTRYGDNRYNQQMLSDWTKQYKRSGDKYSADRCEHVSMEVHKKQNDREKYMNRW